LFDIIIMSIKTALLFIDLLIEINIFLYIKHLTKL
jgi:hypothetical protein